MNTISKVPALFDLTKDVERPANYAVIAIDETSNWKDDIAKKAGKICGVYFVNLMEPTNLCDPAVNYPATFLYNVFDDCTKFSEDEMDDMYFDNGGEDSRYIHEHTKLDECRPYYMPQSWFDEMRADDEDWEESQIEYFKANHVI